MKKIISVFLVIIVIFLYGCAGKETAQSDTDNTAREALSDYTESDTGKTSPDNEYNENENTEEAPSKDYTGYWGHTVYPDDNYVIIYEQQGDIISFVAEALKANGSRIATVRQENINIGSGKATFEFIDSFLNKGVCNLQLIDDTLTLKFNVTGGYQGGWCIDAGNGSYKKIKELSEVDGFNKEDYTIINPDDISENGNAAKNEKHYTESSHSDFMGVWYYTCYSDPQNADDFERIEIVPYGENKAKVLWNDGTFDIFEFISGTEGIGSYGSISKALYCIDRREGVEHFNVTPAKGGDIFQSGAGGYRVVPDYYKK